MRVRDRTGDSRGHLVSFEGSDLVKTGLTENKAELQLKADALDQPAAQLGCEPGLYTSGALGYYKHHARS